MSFENVKVVKKANVYFDGNVTSRTLEFADGTTKSLGVMQPGEYVFATADKEIMEILGGECEVKIAGTDSFKTYKAGDCFEVDANSSFDIKAKTLTDYCCSYIKE